MSNVVDTSVVKDEDKVTVRNLTNMPVAYHVPSLGDLRRELPPRASIKVEAGELRQLNYELGGSTLLRNYLCVENKQLAREFGVSDDTVEYNWTMADIDRALTTDPIEVLQDAMDFAPSGVKETIAQRAVELEIADVNRRAVISNASNYDIDLMIKNKQKIEEPAEDKAEKKPATKRRAASTTTKRRRATKTSATEKASAEE